VTESVCSGIKADDQYFSTVNGILQKIRVIAGQSIKGFLFDLESEKRH
jgi:hypothetical protein